MCIVTDAGETELDAEAGKDDIEETLELIMRSGAYALNDTLKNGYVTLKGGCRAGLCGSAVISNGEICGMKNISSLSLRIPYTGEVDTSTLTRRLWKNRDFRSTLIISPPGGGKTTLLRALVRDLSDGCDGLPPHRVGLCDERGEIAAMFNARAQLNVGSHTDVLDGYPKDKAIMMLLKTMRPEIIAVDEITSDDDVEAIIRASYCGTGFIATAHADGTDDLKKRPVYAKLCNARVFYKAVVITKGMGGRIYECKDMDA